MKTCFSLFSGCGGSDVGMALANFIPIGGIEYYSPAADIYDKNHRVSLTRANILDIFIIPSVDLLWISPPCPSFSIANMNRGETQKDINLATHIAKLIVDSRPRSVAIENVRGYWGSNSCNLILRELENAGYSIEWSIECAADYGAPTTRKRLIIRASLDPIMPIVKTHRKVGSETGQLSLFDHLPNWVSWYDAVESFLHTLPKSTLTERQMTALSSKNLFPQTMVDLGNPRGGKYTVLDRQEPSPTITALRGSRVSSSSKMLIERLGYRGEPNVCLDTPCPTVRAHTHIDDHGCYRVAANILDGYDCYAADIRSLAAWQSFPDTYNWLGNRGEAGRAIGNSVPPLLSKAVAESFCARAPTIHN